MGVINDLNAREARNLRLRFFADEREELQRVFVRPPNVGVVHHDDIQVRVRHQRRCRRHHDSRIQAFGGAFFGD